MGVDLKFFQSCYMFENFITKYGGGGQTLLIPSQNFPLLFSLDSWITGRCYFGAKTYWGMKPGESLAIKGRNNRTLALLKSTGLGEEESTEVSHQKNRNCLSEVFYKEQLLLLSIFFPPSTLTYRKCCKPLPNSNLPVLLHLPLYLPILRAVYIFLRILIGEFFSSLQ